MLARSFNNKELLPAPSMIYKINPGLVEHWFMADFSRKVLPSNLAQPTWSCIRSMCSYDG